jgi:hypothetical protein
MCVIGSKSVHKFLRENVAQFVCFPLYVIQGGPRMTHFNFLRQDFKTLFNKK